MPRPRKVERSHHMSVYLPESVKAKMDIELYSELEGRVPFGAYNNLFVDLVRGWLAERGILV